MYITHTPLDFSSFQTSPLKLTCGPPFQNCHIDTQFKTGNKMLEAKCMPEEKIKKIHSWCCSILCKASLILQSISYFSVFSQFPQVGNCSGDVWFTTPDQTSCLLSSNSCLCGLQQCALASTIQVSLAHGNNHWQIGGREQGRKWTLRFSFLCRTTMDGQWPLTKGHGSLKDPPFTDSGHSSLPLPFQA